MKEQMKAKKMQKHNVKSIKGITLIALVITIVVLLILAAVSITAVFGDNGLLQLAKEAGKKTNEAIKSDLQDIQNIEETIGDMINNGWSISKVTAITSADGKIVPVPKGFVASSATGENIVAKGFVIYEGTEPVTDANVNKARIDRNQFVWVPVKDANIEYKQDKETWSDYNNKEYNDYDNWTDEEEIDYRKASVVEYGGFYVGRYEAGIEESIKYKNGDNYERSELNKDDTNGIPVIKKGRKAWNWVTQIGAKALSEKMYKDNLSVTSRLIDSYAWDTICHWLDNSGIDVKDCTSWGNYLDASFKIKGLYICHTYDGKNWKVSNYKRTKEGETFELPSGRTYTDTEESPRKCYEIETGATVVDESEKEVDRNKANNIYDFAGNMWEWTTELRNIVSETYCAIRGGSFWSYGGGVGHGLVHIRPVVRRDGGVKNIDGDWDLGFRTVLYLNQ